MQQICVTSSGNSPRSTTAGMILFLALSGPALAQQQNPPRSSPPPNPSATSRANYEKYRSDRRAMDARETDVKLAEKGAKELDSNKESIARKRLSDSFACLQTESNEIIKAVKTDSSLDFARITAASIEIKKCAEHLKSDLVFPEARDKKSKRDDSDDTDVKASLRDLDALIKGFVNNPFLTKGVQDETLGVQAGRDLDQIIALSSSIRKHSDKLSKTSLKP